MPLFGKFLYTFISFDKAGIWVYSSESVKNLIVFVRVHAVWTFAFVWAFAFVYIVFAVRQVCWFQLRESAMEGLLFNCSFKPKLHCVHDTIDV